MELINALLGLHNDVKDLTLLQVSVRGVAVFLYCILLVRLADKRFLSHKSAFDAVLGFIFASMMARAINGSAPFLPTLGGGFVLIVCHRFLAFGARKWHFLGGLLKGSADLLIDNGTVHAESLRRNNFSKADMLEDLRLKGAAKPGEVRLAYVERNGEISVVKRGG